MNQELLLLRHGKSDWSIDTDDFHRPLKKRGINGARQGGEWLRKQQLLPDIIISSPAERAIDTAKKTCEMMGLKEQCIQQEQRVYDADLNALKQVLSELSNDVNRVLLVGHNPGLEELLLYLVAGKIRMPKDYKLLPTATLARLTITVPWDKAGENCAELQEIKRPEK